MLGAPSIIHHEGHVLDPADEADAIGEPDAAYGSGRAYTTAEVDQTAYAHATRNDGSTNTVVGRSGTEEGRAGAQWSAGMIYRHTAQEGHKNFGRDARAKARPELARRRDAPSRVAERSVGYRGGEIEAWG